MTLATNAAHAQQAYIAHLARIQQQLAQLQTLVDDHFNVDPDDVHWGHVGDLQRIENALDEILESVAK